MVTTVSGLHNLNVEKATQAQSTHSAKVTDALSRLSTGSDLAVQGKAARKVMDMVLKSKMDLNAQAIRNAGDARAVIGVAASYLKNDIELLDKMKLLAAEAISGSLDQARRTLIGNEFDKLKSQIDLNAQMARWLDTPLLLGGGGGGVNVITTAVANDTSTTTAVANILTAAITDQSTGDFAGTYIKGSLKVSAGSEAGAWNISYDLMSPAGKPLTYTGTDLKFLDNATLDFSSGANTIQALADAAATANAPANKAAVETAMKAWLNDSAVTGATFSPKNTDPTGVNGYNGVTVGAATPAGSYKFEYVVDSGKMSRWNGGVKEEVAVANNATQAVFSDGMAVNFTAATFATNTAIPAFRVEVSPGAATNLSYQLDELGNTITASLPVATAAGLGISTVNVNTPAAATAAMTTIATAQQALQSSSSTLVAQQQQLDAVESNLKAATEQLGIAQSANNTDISKTLSEYVMANAMSQVAYSAQSHALEQTRNLVDSVKRS